jgi:glucoamylase
VDGGFLNLVRYGIRKPDDPCIVDSVRVIDQVLKVDTPVGPIWHRYNHDGYGQREDGTAYDEWGIGRAWPLLTGERGHYELAAGHDVKTFIRAMEGFASPTGFLTEQVWDEEDRPDLHLRLGQPTGSAMPLVWAHAEYIKLLRSAADGEVFDRIPEVAERYLSDHPRKGYEVWSPNHHAKSAKPGDVLRIQASTPFRLRWSSDEWKTTKDAESNATKLGIEYADIPIRKNQHAPIQFTLYWIEDERWEGRNYEVRITR